MTPWKETDTQKLIDLYNKYPNNWVKIAERFKNRETDECRIWYTRINTKIQTGRWSQEEVELLMKYYKIYRGRWAIIAEKLPGRTPLQIKDKFRTMMKGGSKKYNENQKIIDNDDTNTTLVNRNPVNNFSSEYYDIVKSNKVRF